MTVKVVLSYVFDWVVLIAAAGIGAVLDKIEPNKRPFSLTDPNISYVPDLLSTVPKRTTTTRVRTATDQPTR
jgi:hypothetical protein